MKQTKIFKRIIMATALWIFSLPGLSSAASWDPYSGGWMPEELTMFAREEYTIGSGFSFWMYDFDEGMSDSMKLLDDILFSASTVFFTLDEGKWWAGLSESAKTLDLGSTRGVGFYFLNGLNEYDPWYEEVVPEELYDFAYLGKASGMTIPYQRIRVSEIHPVPVPGSIVLLTSGLLGLAGIRRKKMAR